MKIGVLIDRLNVGGVEKIAIEQVKALRSIGEDAFLIVLSRKAVVEGAFSELLKNVPIIYLDDRLPSFLRFTFKFPLFHFFSSLHLTYPFLIPFVVKKNEFDYFIVHSTYTAFTAVSLRKMKHIPYSVFIWDPIGYILQRVYKQKISIILFFILFRISRLFDGVIIRNADTILVGGDAHNSYLRTFSLNKSIIVIPPSVNVKKKITQKKEKVILMVTAWKRGKNPEYIHKLIQKIPSLKIIMAGKWIEDRYKKEFEQFCKEKRIVNNIEILGSVSEKQLSKLYATSLVLLQTNDDRGFGMPALEAAGHGTTFIIPEGQGVCKLFIHGKDGFYTKEKDTKKIVEYLNKLISDKEKAKKLGLHAFTTVQKNYSWKKHADSLVSLIKENKQVS